MKEKLSLLPYGGIPMKIFFLLLSLSVSAFAQAADGIKFTFGPHQKYPDYLREFVKQGIESSGSEKVFQSKLFKPETKKISVVLVRADFLGLEPYDNLETMVIKAKKKGFKLCPIGAGPLLILELKETLIGDIYPMEKESQGKDFHGNVDVYFPFKERVDNPRGEDLTSFYVVVGNAGISINAANGRYPIQASTRIAVLDR